MDSVETVSLIILNYNGKDLLEDCLQSIDRMTFPRDRLEVILADNGSTDGSLDFVRDRFPWVTIHAYDENLGFSAGNNRAVRQATGSYVGFLNNDTRVDPGWLEPLHDALRENPDAICAGARVLDFDGKRLLYQGGDFNICGFGYLPGLNDPVERHPIGATRETGFATGCAMLARREEFLATGGFDEDYFAYYEDVDLGWRWQVLGYRVLYVPASIVYHEGGASFQHSSSDSKHLLWNRNVLYTMLKNYEESHLRKLFPVALLLTLERALYFLDVKGIEATARVLAHFPGLDEEMAHEQRRAVGIAHLRAIQDVILKLPAMLEKRAEIQQHRKASDEEIFRRLSLRVDVEGQVNALRNESLIGRLLPFLSLDHLLDRDRVDRELLRNLERLESEISGYQSTCDGNAKELLLRGETIERQRVEIETMNKDLERLVPMEIEFERIKKKRWYRAIMAVRRILSRKPK